MKELLTLSCCGLWLLTAVDSAAAAATRLHVVSQQRTSQTSAGAALPDEIQTAWDKRKKRFIVVAASNTAGVHNNLPFAKVDGRRVKEALLAKGYEEIATLPGKLATRDNFISSLKKVRPLEPDSLVVVYYSGHAVKDPQEKDLWLQLAEQSEFGDHFGLSIREIIGAARGNTYRGQLVIILDACYSGQSAALTNLTVNELEQTIIFSSSSKQQQSYPIEVSSGVEMSAFTYCLLRGLTVEWPKVDENQDGIVLYSDLQTYIENELLRLLSNKTLTSEMTPELLGAQGKIWAAYDSGLAKNLQSQLREILRHRVKLNPASIFDPNPHLPKTPIVEGVGTTQEARELAKRVSPSADVYTRALKATAEENFEEAMRLLNIAEKENVVTPAEIYEARGNVFMQQARFSEGIVWYERALQASRPGNVELIEEVAGANLLLSNVGRAETLFNHALTIRRASSTNSPKVVMGLTVLMLIKFMQGDILAAEAYVKELQRYDDKVLDAEEAGISDMLRFFSALLDLIRDNTKVAAAKLEAILAAPNKQGGIHSVFRSMSLMGLAGIYIKDDKMDKATPLINQFSDLLEEALDAERLDEATMLLNFVAGFHAGRSRPLPGSDRLEQLVQRSLPLIRQAEGENSPNIISALMNVADSYVGKENYKEAEALYQEALAYSDRMGMNGIIGVPVRVKMGRLYEITGRNREAEEIYKRALAMAVASFGDQGVFTLLVIDQLGGLYERTGRLLEAEQSYRKALELIQKQFGKNTGLSTSTIEDLARLLEKLNRHQEAELLLVQSLNIQESNPIFPEIELVDTLIQLGANRFKLKRFDEAAQVLSRADRILAAHPKPDRRDWMKCLSWLAQASRDGGNTTLADQSDERVLALAKRVLAEDKPDPVVAVYLYTLAGNYGTRRLFSKAEQFYQLTIQIDEKAYDPAHAEVATDLQALAQLYLDEGKREESLAHFRRAREIFGKQPKPALERMATISNRVGQIHYDKGDLVEAEKAFQESVKLWEQVPIPAANEHTSSVAWLAWVYKHQNNHKARATVIERLLLIDEKTQPPDWSVITEDLLALGDVYIILGRHDEAERYLQRARTGIEQHLGKKHRLMARYHLESAQLAAARNQAERAEAQFKTSIALSGKLAEKETTENDNLIYYLREYANWLRRQGRNNEAETHAAQAEKIRAKYPKMVK